MKLLIVSYLYAPDVCGGAPIFTDLCEGLASRGIDVTVRCTPPFYPEWTDKSGLNGINVIKTTISSVKIERYGLYIPNNPRSIVQRLLYEASHFCSLMRSIFNGTFDAIIVFCPLIGSTAFGAIYKYLHGIPALLDVEDLPANAAATSGIAKNKLLVGCFSAIQKALFNRYDAFRAITPVMAKSLAGLVANNRPVLTIPHWVHPSLLTAIDKLPSKVGRRPQLPLKLLYSGNIGNKQGLLDFCKALRASDLPFIFQINGNGAGAADIHNWLGTTCDYRFRFGPLTTESNLALSLYNADLCVITEKPDKTASFFPSKLIPIITSGTPVLCVSDPSSPLGSEVLSYDLGQWFSWDTVTDSTNLWRS